MKINQRKEKATSEKIGQRTQVKSMIDLDFLKKIIEDQYDPMNNVTLTPFPYKGVIPNHFVVRGPGKKRWFLKIREMDRQNVEMLETLYNLLEKKNFPTLYPLKNSRGKYIATVFNLMLYISPYLNIKKNETPKSIDKKIDLFSNFCNIANSSRVLKATLNRRKHETDAKDFDYVMSSARHARSLEEFFGDISGLEGSVRDYFENCECRRVCHGDCGGRNFLDSREKMVLIDFEDVGLGDLKFEIFRLAHDGTKNFPSNPEKKFFGNIERINRRLKPVLRFSKSDFSKLGMYLFLYNALRLRYRPEKDIFSKKYAVFCDALRKKY